MLQQQVDELICRRFYLTYHAAASRCYLQKNVYTVANVSGGSRPSYYFIVLEKVINLMSKSIIISLVKLFETCLIKIVVQNKKNLFLCFVCCWLATSVLRSIFVMGALLNDIRFAYLEKLGELWGYQLPCPKRIQIDGLEFQKSCLSLCK